MEPYNKKGMQLIEYPKKLILEPTTRCNFKCEMCVKQSSGCEILEGNLENDVFSKCEKLFPSLESVIFTGVGEPLLNQNLEVYMSKVKKTLPAHGTIGFQTNGKLLTQDRAEALLRSGLNKICISVDTIQPGLFDQVREGGRLSDVELAFEALMNAKEKLGQHRLSLGIEFVLMKKNMNELPLLVEWADKRQVDFIIVTHLTAYEKDMEHQIAFLNNSFESLDLFEDFRQKGLEKNIDIKDYEKIRWRTLKSEKEVEIYKLIAAFKESALEKKLYVNLFHLLSESADEYDRMNAVFERTRSKAHSYGIELVLPGIRPKTHRYCPFVETDAMFVTWDGKVSPCYFLWHKYTAARIGYTKHITPIWFGNVLEFMPEQIWNDSEYKSFRTKVKQYDYPNCHAWCETRCDYVLDEPFYQDCFINDIPCADCHWNLGFLNCLI